MEQIQFGTDGWRGVIGVDFTLENVRHVAAATARYIREEGEPSRGLVLSYDTRYLSPESAQAAAEVVAATGIPVILADRATPTPAASYAVVARGAAGGVIVTASHNPYYWNGIKFKEPHGGSAASSVVRRIEIRLRRLGATRERPGTRRRGKTETIDLVSPYLDRLKALVSLECIRASGLKFVIDPMYGAAAGCVSRLFESAGITFREIHAERDPFFGGINPEPIEPHIGGLRKAVVEGDWAAGLATDGDGDRVGAVDGDGTFIDSHKIFSILLNHRVKFLKQRGEVVKTFSTTQMIDKIAARYNLRLHTTRIGFKHICKLMLKRDVLMGGEESGGIGIRGHLPERDGVLNSLLLAEVMAARRRTLGELVRELSQEFGPHFYSRVDLQIEKARAQEIVRRARRFKHRRLAGLEATAVQNLDGVKLIFGDSAWLLVRASGTENVLRLYAEAPSSEQVKGLLEEITAFARGSG